MLLDRQKNVLDSAHIRLDSFDTHSISIDTLKGIKPLKPITSIPYTIWEIMGFSLIFLFVTGLLVLIYLRQARIKKTTLLSKKVVNPLAKAFLVLDQLLGADYYRNADFYLYYTEVSKVVRVYIYDTFTINSEYLSTKQTLRTFQALKLSNSMSQNLRNKLADFFERADLIKFGGYKANSVQAEELNKEVKELLLELEKLKKA